jgi:hypothetical protein
VPPLLWERPSATLNAGEISTPYLFVLSRRRRGNIWRISGRGAARLAHLLWEQGVVGSNPTAPTMCMNKVGFPVLFHR